MLVSVIMPLYNKELYVREAVESILNQTYKDFEIVIVDDCSTDDSKNVIKSFNDNRIRLIELDRNMGVSYSSNTAIQNSKGKYILRMDADDISDKRRLEKQLEFALKYDADVVGSRFDIISDSDIPAGLHRFESYNNSVVNQDEIIRDFTIMPTVVQGTMLLKKNIFNNSLYYSSSYSTAEDYEQLGRMIVNGVRIMKVPEVLLHYRYIKTSLSNSKSLEGVLNGIRIKLDFIYKYYKLYEKKDKNFIIWGIKEFAGYLKDELEKPKYNAEVKCFTDFDYNMWGSMKDELAILPPEEAISRMNKNDIVLTMWNIGRDKIIDYLNKKELKRNNNYFVLS